ncbi:MAG: SIMPL domain-containing protein [Chitinophagaceae bacterium]|nr:SIMPL domain-containing protein [Chitinophagaceae bacterium]
MKKLLLPVILFCFFAIAGKSQQTPDPFPKTIAVTGSAEMEVIPDEVYVNVSLREYQKKGDPKKDIETIKAAFLASCRQSGIPDSAISISSFTGYNSYYSLRKKQKAPDLFAGITYQVKFTTSAQMDELVDKLDDEATQSFDIAYTSHSKMPEFRKQLKIQAVKAAKNKAEYLTEAIDEKLGPAITVKEPEEPGTRSTNAVNVSNAVSPYYYDKQVSIVFKKIRIRYEVNVVFALD